MSQSGISRKSTKQRNPVARALQNRALALRVVKSKKVYDRNSKSNKKLSRCV